jgi:hypothetical protein
MERNEEKFGWSWWAWICWHLIREPLGLSCPQEGSSENGWKIVAARGAEPQDASTSRNPRKGRTDGTSTGWTALRREQCNGFDQRTAMQRLRRHGPARRNRTGLCNPLLGNSPVNAFQHTRQAAMEEPVFSTRWRRQQYRDYVFNAVRAEAT